MQMTQARFRLLSAGGSALLSETMKIRIAFRMAKDLPGFFVPPCWTSGALKVRSGSNCSTFLFPSRLFFTSSRRTEQRRESNKWAFSVINETLSSMFALLIVQDDRFRWWTKEQNFIHRFEQLSHFEREARRSFPPPREIPTSMNSLCTCPSGWIEFYFADVVDRIEKSHTEKVLQEMFSFVVLPRRLTCLVGRGSAIFSRSNCIVFEQMIASVRAHCETSAKIEAKKVWKN